MNFIDNLETFGSQIALQDENGNVISYEELAQKADSLSNKIGSKKRFIFVSSNNNIDTIIGYIAALRGGHAVLMLDSNLNASLSDDLIKHYKPNGIWADGGNGYQYTQFNCVY